MKNAFEEAVRIIADRFDELVDLYFPVGALKPALILALLSTWVLIGAFCYLNRYTRRRYFAIWTVGWVCYAFWITATIMSLDDGFRMKWEWLKQVCVGGCALFLFFGTLEFSGNARRSREMIWMILFVALWSFAIGNFLKSAFWLSLLLFWALSATNFWTAGFFFQKSLSQRYIGAGLLGVSFALWAVQMGIYPFLESFDVSRPRIFIATSVTQLVIAIGMVVLMLEETRGEEIWLKDQVKTDLRLVRRLQKEIGISEDRYEHIFEHSSDSIFVVDPSSLQILEVNHAARALTGYSREELLQLRFVNLCSFLRSKEKEIAQDPSQVQKIFSSYGNMSLQRKDNNLVLVEGSASMMSHSKGQTAQIFLREVTERRRLEQQLRQAEKLSALGQLISGVTHELNNPLAVISGYAQLLAMRPAVDEKTRGDLLKIQRESERASRIVQNFLTFARKQPVEKTNVNLNDLIKVTLELMDYDLRASGVRLVEELGPDLPQVFADPNQLEQVFLNIVNNAVQSMDGNSREKVLKIKTECSATHVKATLVDSGKGIPAEILGKVFDPFFTTKDVSVGTGLGLSISFSIIKEHAGSIYAQNDADDGAMFIVELPISHVKTSKKEEPDERALHKDLPPRVFHRDFYALVVDDEPAIQDVFSELLMDYSCRVQHTDHALDAIKLIQQQNFDLVLCDLKMPGMDGQRLHARVKDMKPDVAKNFIFITGDTNSTRTLDFLKKTDCLWLAKPFNFREIESLLSEHFRRIQDEERRFNEPNTTSAKSQKI